MAPKKAPKKDPNFEDNLMKDAAASGMGVQYIGPGGVAHEYPAWTKDPGFEQRLQQDAAAMGAGLQYFGPGGMQYSYAPTPQQKDPAFEQNLQRDAAAMGSGVQYFAPGGVNYGYAAPPQEDAAKIAANVPKKKQDREVWVKSLQDEAMRKGMSLALAGGPSPRPVTMAAPAEWGYGMGGMEGPLPPVVDEQQGQGQWPGPALARR